MVEMSNREWERVLERFQDKVDRIIEMEINLELLRKENKENSKERIQLAKETAKLGIENVNLEIENTKLKKEQERTNASLSTILSTLNEALNTMERHGLKTKNRRVTANSLDLIV